MAGLNKLQMQVWGRLNKPEPNVTFGGIGGLGITKAMIAEDLAGISSSNIENFIDDGTDIKVYINTSCYFYGFASKRGTPSATQALIADNITSVDDPTGVFTAIIGNSFYNIANPCTFNLQGVESIGREGFRNVGKCIELICPKLKSLSTSNPLYETATLQNVPIYFPLLEGNVRFSSHSRFYFTGESPLLTGTIYMSKNATSSIFPFPNATGIYAQGFRDYLGQGVVSLPNVTTFNGSYTFFAAINITELYLQNVTHITSPNLTFRDMNSLEILDIRNMVDFGGLSSTYFRFGTPANWTVHANAAMQTAGTGGTMHPSFQDIINRGATIIWY